MLFFSGIYIAIDFFGKKHKISAKSYTDFAIEKWLRFNIRCIGPILVIFILSALGSGPIWHLGHEYFEKDCKMNYWKNLLFINNFSRELVSIGVFI